MSYTHDALTILEDSGLGATGVVLFEGTAPDTASTAVVVNQYAGGSPLYPTDVESPGLQARVRAPVYSDAETLAHSVMRALGAVAEQTVAGHRYLQIDARSSPAYVGPDARGRHEFVVSFNVLAERH